MIFYGDDRLVQESGFLRPLNLKRGWLGQTEYYGAQVNVSIRLVLEAQQANLIVAGAGKTILAYYHL